MQPEALRLTYIWIVHSDLDENNLYSEFDSEDKALDYARRHADDLTWVEKVEVAVDEFDEIVEYHDGETIWMYVEEDELSDEEIEKLIQADEDRKWAEAALGDTTWFEDLDTDKLVETLEENEDIVECKECFELFPKEACTKIAIGYICPECGKIHSHEEPEFEIDSIPEVVIADDDFFKVDFPELERMDYGNDMIPDEPTPEVENDPISEPEPMPEVGPNPEPCVGPECEAPVEAPVTKEETIATLVKDEEEAIEGYDKAKVEIEANSELDEKEKEEILDTIEHIKEEEIEHIEELEELVDETEETKADEPAEESKPEETKEPEILAESQVQEISELYRSLSKKYNIDLEDLVYGEEGFMKTKYPEGFPDFAGDVIYSEKYWNEFEAWLKETRGVELTESLTEHVNEEHPAIESDQELEGTDNAVVDCKVNKVITHSEDEKPVDCEGKKKPLEKPLTETTHAKYAKPEGDHKAAYNNALKYAKKYNCEFIYGYHEKGTGKFFALEQPIKCTNLRQATADFYKKYTRASSAMIAYPDKDFITESLVENIEDDLIKAYNDIPVVEADLEAIEQELSKLRRTEIYDAEDYKELKAKVSAIRKEISDLEDTYGHFICINADGDRDWVVFDKEKEAELAPKIAELNSTWRTLDSELDTLISERSTEINNTYGADLEARKAKVTDTKASSKAALTKYIEAEKINIENAIRELDAERDYKLDLAGAAFLPKTNTVIVPFTHTHSEELTIEDFDFDGDDATCSYSDYDAEEYASDYLDEYLPEALGLDLEVDEDGDYIIPNSDWRLLKDPDIYFDEIPELSGYSYSPATYWDPAEEDYEIEGKLVCSITCYLIKKLGTKPALKESLYKFTKEEQEEYNMDEDGNSLDSYDTYIRCGFCDEIYTKSECKYERNLGWLCPRCEAAIYSRGEKLTFVDPDEFLN